MSLKKPQSSPLTRRDFLARSAATLSVSPLVFASTDAIHVAAAPATSQALHEDASMTRTTMRKRIVLTRRSPAYWRVTLDHPPLNIFGPETIPELNEIITSRRHPGRKPMFLAKSTATLILTNCRRRECSNHVHHLSRQGRVVQG